MDWHEQKPMDIEHESFRIIGEEMGDVEIPEEELPIVKRVIHTTADFDYLKNLYFSPDAVQAGIAAIKGGAHIVTDTRMAWSGISKKTLERFGGEAICFMSDDDVAAEAKERGVTRAAVSMEHACNVAHPLIIAVGNAPTALLRLDELMKAGSIKPDLIIGVPVGFVNVVESKEVIRDSGATCILAMGRKGGSNVAACICNALLYMAYESEGGKR